MDMLMTVNFMDASGDELQSTCIHEAQRFYPVLLLHIPCSTLTFDEICRI